MSDRGLVPIRRALISVFDKNRLPELSGALNRHGVEVFSTGNTAGVVAATGAMVSTIESVTGFPEMMDGRVKSVSPLFLAGTIGDWDKPNHVSDAEAHQIPHIDLVVINFYDFVGATADPDCTSDTASNNMDVGGPMYVEAAIKNRKFVAVLTSPTQYDEFIAALDRNNGCLSLLERCALAANASVATEQYATAKRKWLNEIELPRILREQTGG